MLCATQIFTRKYARRLYVRARERVYKVMSNAKRFSIYIYISRYMLCVFAYRRYASARLNDVNIFQYTRMNTVDCQWHCHHHHQQQHQHSVLAGGVKSISNKSISCLPSPSPSAHHSMTSPHSTHESEMRLLFVFDAF